MIKIQILSILTALLPGLLGQDSPCVDSWGYSKTNGKCYKAVNVKASQSSANSTCFNLLTAVNANFQKIKPRLIRLQNDNDVLAFSNYMISIANNVPVWLDTSYNQASRTWLWSDGTPVNTTLLGAVASGTDVVNQCLKFKYEFSMLGGGFSKRFEMSNESCSNEGYFVCEHDSNACGPATFPFSADINELIPNSNKPFNLVHVACRFGYYRIKPTSPGKPGPIPREYAYCTGTRHPSQDPSLYTATWNFSDVERCQAVSCAPFSGVLNNVVSQIVPPMSNSQTQYALGYKFNVSCNRGFVSYTDKTMQNATVECQQSLVDKTQGVWAPINYTPCVALQCNTTSLEAMIPANAQMLSFRNKITQNKYDPKFQRSLLPQFNNIVTIQCFDGYFFPDRSYFKEVICDLVNNSLIYADWQGYPGTSLPLYPSCQNSTCKYESILISNGSNLQPYFMMKNSDGVYVNQTDPTGNPYPFETQLLFYCVNGSSTGSGATSQNLTCGPQGIWRPNLTPCIVLTPPLDVGNAKYFIPPAVEAASAQQIGCAAIIVLVIFLSLIVLLDTSTIVRDVKLMKNNIKTLKGAMGGKNE